MLSEAVDSQFYHFDRSSTPSMDSDHTSDSDADDSIMSPIEPLLPAQGGGIQFVSPFAAYKTVSVNSVSPNYRAFTSASDISSSSSLLSPRSKESLGAPWSKQQSLDIPSFQPTSSSLRRGSHINPTIRQEIENAGHDRRRNSVDAAVLAEFSVEDGSYQRRSSKRPRAGSRAGKQFGTTAFSENSTRGTIEDSTSGSTRTNASGCETMLVMLKAF